MGLMSALYPDLKAPPLLKAFDESKVVRDEDGRFAHKAGVVGVSLAAGAIGANLGSRVGATVVAGKVDKLTNKGIARLEQAKGHIASVTDGKGVVTLPAERLRTAKVNSKYAAKLFRAAKRLNTTGVMVGAGVGFAAAAGFTAHRLTQKADLTEALLKSWDESKHRRDEDGKFASKGGVSAKSVAVGAAAATIAAAGTAASVYEHARRQGEYIVSGGITKKIKLQHAAGMNAYAAKVTGLASVRRKAKRLGNVANRIVPAAKKLGRKAFMRHLAIPTAAAAAVGGGLFGYVDHLDRTQKADITDALLKSWDESKHVRDGDGRFATKGAGGDGARAGAAIGAIGGGLALGAAGAAAGLRAGMSVSRSVAQSISRIPSKSGRVGAAIGAMALGALALPAGITGGVAAGTILGSAAGGVVGSKVGGLFDRGGEKAPPKKPTAEFVELTDEEADELERLYAAKGAKIKKADIAAAFLRSWGILAKGVTIRIDNDGEDGRAGRDADSDTIFDEKEKRRQGSYEGSPSGAPQRRTRVQGALHGAKEGAKYGAVSLGALGLAAGAVAGERAASAYGRAAWESYKSNEAPGGWGMRGVASKAIARRERSMIGLAAGSGLVRGARKGLVAGILAGGAYGLLRPGTRRET